MATRPGEAEMVSRKPDDLMLVDRKRAQSIKPRYFEMPTVPSRATKSPKEDALGVMLSRPAISELKCID